MRKIDEKEKGRSRHQSQPRYGLSCRSSIMPRAMVKGSRFGRLPGQQVHHGSMLVVQSQGTAI